MPRLRLTPGVLLVALATVALLTLGIHRGLSRQNAVLLALSVAVLSAGTQLLRAHRKNERAHEVKLAKLADRVKPPTRSDRPGGADPGHEPRK